ncbi:MAG: NUDIX hydrolase [Mycobacterium sp.]
MHSDGDGWVVSERGTYHWGVYGAAGLLLRAPWHDGTPAVLLQHRAPWSHQGGTWALPGGARGGREEPHEAALREAREEAGLDRERIEIHACIETMSVPARGGGAWTYITVVAEVAEMLATVPNGESSELRWVPEREVDDLDLHPGFRASWHRLRITEAVPPHSCGMERPHALVVAERTFWCSAADLSEQTAQP